MRNFFLFLLILFIPALAHASTFTKTRISGIDFKYVTYGIGSDIYNIKVLVSNSGAVSLEELAQKNNALIAINGIFFCPSDYPQCGWKDYTINERFVNWQDLSFYPDTGDRWIFGWDENEMPFIHQTGKIHPEKRGDIFEWLWNFPILYADGKNMLEHYHDVWLYDIKMKTPLARHFVCSNKNKTKIIFWRTGPTSLDNLAPALHELWCWDALNLDAWNSSQYIYNGRTLVSWPRKILDGIWIERVWLNVQKIEDKVDRLFPLLMDSYKNLSLTRKKQELKKLSDLLVQLRTKVYDKNSDDIYDSDGIKIWYQINTTDVTDIKKIYVYNALERKINKEIAIISEKQVELLKIYESFLEKKEEVLD